MTTLQAIFDSQEEITTPQFYTLANKMCQAVSAKHYENSIFLYPHPSHIQLSDTWTEVTLPDVMPKPDSLTMDYVSYYSPEQTGRINRAKDTRSDIWTLGVFFYRLLYQKLPFVGENGNALSHEIVTGTLAFPESSHPIFLQTVIAKMLEKAPESRYQSVAGLLADLKRIQRGESDFSLASTDAPERLQMHQRPYGCQEQLDAIKEKLLRAEIPNRIFISGEAGVGKTTLLDSISGEECVDGFLTCRGQYDDGDSSAPFAGIISACDALIQPYLELDADRQVSVRDSLTRALSPNIGLISALIPSLEEFLGKVPLTQPLELRPSQARSSLIHGLLKLIKHFATEEKPLLMLLDDLQWADEGSLDFVFKDIPYFTIIAAYRDGDLPETHRLNEVNSISLGSLTSDQLEKWIEDSLGLEEVSELSSVIHQKTDGNPFFVIALMQQLFSLRLISFDTKWKWNLEEIRDRAISKDVVQTLLHYIDTVPGPVKEMLKFAASFGTELDVDLLEKKYPDARQLLLKAVSRNLLAVDSGKYSFIHQRVHSAFLTLRTEMEIDEHAEFIGRAMLERVKANPDSNSVSVHAVNFLNKAMSRLEPATKVELAQLNLKAGLAAMLRTAYDLAADYFNHGLELLDGQDQWKFHYSLCFDLHAHEAVCAALLSDVDRSNRLFESALEHAKTDHEKMDIFISRAELALGFYDFNGVIEYVLSGLALENMRIPKTPDDIQAAMENLRQKLTTQLTTTQIGSLSKTQDLKIQAKTQRLLANLAVSSYFSGNMNLHLLAIYHGISTSLDNGYNHYTAFMFAFYALDLITREKAYDKAVEFAEKALDLSEENPSGLGSALARMVVATTSLHFGKPLSHCVTVLEEATELGFSSGDPLAGVLSYGNALVQKVAMGMSLDQLQGHQESFESMAKTNHVGPAADIALMYRFFFNGLREKNKNALNDDQFESAQLGQIKASNGISFLMHLRVQLFFYLDAFQEVAKILDEAEEKLSAVPGYLMTVDHFYFKGMTIAMLYPGMQQQDQPAALEQVKLCIEKLKELASSPGGKSNFEHKYQLLSAELLRLTMAVNDYSALTQYKAAINSATVGNNLSILGTAYSRLAIFWADRGCSDYCALDLHKALDVFARWGVAQKRITYFIKKSSNFSPLDPFEGESSPEQHRPNLSSSFTISSNIAASTSALDIEAVEQVVEVLSMEQQLQHILEISFTTLLRMAGAERGSLVIAEEDKLQVRASHNGGQTTVQTIELADWQGPHSIVLAAHQHHTRTTLENATASRSTLSDQTKQYFTVNQTKSVLCFPVHIFGGALAVVYLENNTIQNAFSQERNALLEFFAYQLSWLVNSDSSERSIQAQAVKHAALQEFIAGAEHDVRNILLAYSLWMEQELSEEKQEIDLTKIREQAICAINMAALISDSIVAFVELERSGINFNYENINLRRLIDTPVKAAAFYSRDKNITVSSEVIGEDVSVAIPSLYVSRVLWNLLHNAVKFSSENDKIDVIISHKDGNLELIVRDSGAGMSEEDLAVIFQEFRGGNEQSGSGVGLYYCQRILHKMGGDIRVTSELDCGSEFTVSIPSRLTLKQEITSQTTPEAQKARLNGARVLYVEDNKHIRRPAVRSLEERGCIVTAVGSYEEGLEAFQTQEQPFSLILLDANLVGHRDAKGVQLAKVMYESWGNQLRIPIILFSGTPTMNSEEKPPFVSIRLIKNTSLDGLFAAMEKLLPPVPATGIAKALAYAGTTFPPHVPPSADNAEDQPRSDYGNSSR